MNWQNCGVLGASLFLWGELPRCPAAELRVRYDAGLAGGPIPVSPTNYTFNGQKWLSPTVPASGVTNGPITGDGGFNAWNTSDNSAAAGAAEHYSYSLSQAVHDIATNGGWKLRARTRMVASFGSSDSCFLEYGNGTNKPRFLIFLNLNSSNNLTAQLQGLNTFVLTTNGQGNATYHFHEIVGNPAGQASYYFDGQLVTNNWNGFLTASAVNGVRFGAGSTAGRGSMNYNSVEWMLLGTNPVTTTQPAMDLEPYQATLMGTVNPGGLSGRIWFQWGTTTSYGNTTTNVLFANETNAVSASQVITGLSAGGGYHFRCVAMNALGASFGHDQTFTTPTQFTVTTLANSGVASLRQAIANAKSGDTILFATNGMITLATGELVIARNLTIIGSNPELLAVSGNNLSRIFRITSGVTVNISGLKIRNGRTANGVNGSDTNSPGGPGGPGAGIQNAGTLSLSNCVITANTNGNGGRGYNANEGNNSSAGGQGGEGGGIFNSGSLTLTACTVSGNAAGAGGDGGDTDGHDPGAGGDGGPGGDGGGIHNAGVMTVGQSTLSGNVAGTGGTGGNGGNGEEATGGVGGAGGAGGAIYSGGTLTMASSTISGNRGGKGGIGGRKGSRAIALTGGNGGHGGSSGAIYSSGPFSLTASTVAGNTSGAGGNGANATASEVGGTGGNGGDAGALFNAGLGSAGFLRNTVIASNTNAFGGAGGTSGGASGLPGFAPDLKGTFTSEGHNLVGKNDGYATFIIAPSATGDQIGTLGSPINPLLGPLTSHSGPTFTMAPLAGSPARNSGDSLLAPTLITDQRGFPRLSGSNVDIGAFEVQMVSNPPLLTPYRQLANGNFEFTFTNVPGASFTVLTSTNVALPLTSWSVLGEMTEVLPGQYLFSGATTTGARFFLVQWQ